MSRKLPILIRKGTFSGQWFALTNYSVKTWPDSRQRITAREGGKHDVSAEIERIVAQARIEEIEDIDQSRDVVQTEDGTWTCQHCTMTLKDRESPCACNMLYLKRKHRIERLRKEVGDA